MSNEKSYTELMTALMELTCFGKPLKPSKLNLLQQVVYDLNKVDYSKNVMDFNIYISAFFHLLIKQHTELVEKIIIDPNNHSLWEQLQKVKLLNKKKLEETNKMISSSMKNEMPAPRGKAGK